jgi:Phage integrase, N-terminal SAM-like domain
MDELHETRQPTCPVVDPNVTVNAYAELWLATIEATVKPRTRESYRKTLRLHILPAVGLMKIRLLPKAEEGRCRWQGDRERCHAARVQRLRRDELSVVNMNASALAPPLLDPGPMTSALRRSRGTAYDAYTSAIR